MNPACVATPLKEILFMKVLLDKQHILFFINNITLVSISIFVVPNKHKY